METYGLTKEIFAHLLRSANENGYDTLTEYILKESPNTYVIVDNEYHYIKQGGEENVDAAYYSYGSYEAAVEGLDELPMWTQVHNALIITELQFLCANGFNATKFFVNNIDNAI